MRPKCECKISYCPKFRSFVPVGANKSTPEIELSREEAEALRLKDVKDMDQTEAAEKMGISQSSFQRILQNARKKTSQAIFKGMILKIADKK